MLADFLKFRPTIHQNYGDSVSLNKTFSKETFTMEFLISFTDVRVCEYVGGGGEGRGERTTFFIDVEGAAGACQRQMLSLLL